MDDQTTPQTSVVIRGRPFRPGPDPRRGRGPARGAPNAGRPPDEFRQLLASLVSREETIRALERILGDSSHPHFMAALKFAAERAYGLPRQAIDVNASERFVILVPPKAKTSEEWAAMHQLGQT